MGGACAWFTTGMPLRGREGRGEVFVGVHSPLIEPVTVTSRVCVCEEGCARPLPAVVLLAHALLGVHCHDTAAERTMGPSGPFRNCRRRAGTGVGYACRRVTIRRWSAV